MYFGPYLIICPKSLKPMVPYHISYSTQVHRTLRCSITHLRAPYLTVFLSYSISHQSVLCVWPYRFFVTLAVILNHVFNIINSERYLATHHCYPRHENVKWYDNSFCDNNYVYNYPFALMSILNTRHRPCHPCSVQYWAHRHLSFYAGWENSI